MMIKYFKKQKWILGIILILMFIEPSITSWMNFYLQDMFNLASNGGEALVVFRMITIIFIAWMGKRLIVFTTELLKVQFICALRQEIKHALFVKLLRLDAFEIMKNSDSGDYISLFTNDITILEDRFFKHIVNLVSNIISIVILSIAFVNLNATLAKYIIMFGLISMFVPSIFAETLTESNFIYSEKLALLTQRTKEFFSAYPTIKNYSMEKTIEERFEKINENTENAKLNSECNLAIANSIGSLTAWFMQFIAVGIGLMMVVNGECLIGTVIAAQSFASDLGTPLQVVIGNINSIRSMSQIVKKMDDRIERIDNDQETDFETDCPIKISFDKVSCKLDKTQILEEFTFDFDAGKKYLILGKNGSGKSTLFRALKKFQGGIKGDILLNNVSYTKLNNAQLSRSVSYLNENVSVFGGKISENITLFNECDREQIKNVVEKAQIHLDLTREISDSGLDISSGERRRIEIARSLLTNAPVLIFDEVVSTLDIEAAYDIEKMVLGYDKTIIFISHNFSGKLIREYDEILLMDNGKLIAHGRYEELLNQSPYFKHLCEIKFGEYL